jgi:hypothetical protein
MFRVYVTVLMILMGVQTAFAKDFPGPDKSRERFEIVTLWKMMDAIDVDQPTADKIMSIHKKFNGERKTLHKSMEKDYQGLKEKLAQTKDPQDQELAKIVDDIKQKKRQMENLRHSEYDEVAKLLTVKQRAELLLFFRDFKKEMRGMMRQPGAPDRMGPPMPGQMPGRMPPPPHGQPRPEGDDME